MPTTLHRHQVTETEEVHAALEVARTVWPDDPPAKLLTRLALVGADRLTSDPTTRGEVRRRALAELRAAHPWPQGSGWLEAMREQDWAE
ncbi:hypothetical protein ATJ88_0178 [Isoptericola jiangsuensis]|uniref:Uncharacterized protein n=1 Tax=Isoptericola jiangsuensis TaxID=548579 RepID=A0A2A9ESJ9_9MICO|nr:hypothetical protein [Isoptericola jiangsuensis]PFG41536.1 hypothetical protein ATJ88_0178 [Isoptericola jiangsuensis]